MASAIYGIYAVGSLWLVTSTFAIDHGDLFGITQGTGFDIYKKLGIGTNGNFVSRLHFHYCRHPIMWGFFCIFFITPMMTVNHLFFAVSLSIYIVISVKLFEEPDLRSWFPKEYPVYEKTTPAFCPIGKFIEAFGADSKVKAK